MDNTTPFPSGFPLHELPELTKEVFFAFHLQINKLIYLNAAFEKVWTIPREKINSDFRLLLETIHPEDRAHVDEAYKSIIRDRQHQEIEFRIIIPNGEQKWIKLNAYTTQKNNPEIIVGTAFDITAYKDYSDTLHKFSDKKNSILQILSHDLLGPLGVIETSTMLISKYEKIKEDAPIVKLLDLIKKSSKKSVEMIRDLINDEFLQSSETSLLMQRVDIVEKIRRIINQMQQTPHSIPDRFTLISSPDSLFINIDESKFMQVITNLLSNSLKFTPDTGYIRVFIEDLEKNVLIKVQDNGIGIPESLQPYLFDKFTKARRKGLHGEQSTGLGMSIIKTIVEWHHGRIWFESTEGIGTTFFIEIPKDN